MIKEMIIPVALFAVTATGVSAFNTDMLDKIDVSLTDTQIIALEEAHELRESGADHEEIKALLEAVDLDREKMREIKTAVREVREENREAVKVTLETNDYAAFQATAPDQLLETINSEATFQLLVDAHELRVAGDKEGAKEIMSDLGMEKPEKDHAHNSGEGRGKQLK